MIKQAYINGFMRKCAEYGINPQFFINPGTQSPIREYPDKYKPGIKDKLDRSIINYFDPKPRRSFRDVASSLLSKLKAGALSTPAAKGVRR